MLTHTESIHFSWSDSMEVASVKHLGSTLPGYPQSARIGSRKKFQGRKPSQPCRRLSTLTVVTAMRIICGCLSQGKSICFRLNCLCKIHSHDSSIHKGTSCSSFHFSGESVGGCK